MHANITFAGTNYSMVDGIRSTTDAKNSSDQPNLFLFGGSTVLCEEVPDRLTNASILQRMLNLLQESVQVFNYGASGATSIDRIQMLLQESKVTKDDIVVFYFGDNDSGWIDHRTGKPSVQLIWLPIRVLRAMSDLGSETAKWMYGEFSPRSFHKYSRLAVEDTISALNQAFEHCSSIGANMVAVLQPNLYTLLTKSAYEKKLERRFSRDLKTLIIDAYKNYEVWIKTVPYGVSATHIFDNAPAQVFLDWAHVNARGNELIAKFIFEELKKRNLISVDEEV
jgi:lysophospholipase L1-like esterase